METERKRTYLFLTRNPGRVPRPVNFDVRPVRIDIYVLLLIIVITIVVVGVTTTGCEWLVSWCWEFFGSYE